MTYTRGLVTGFLLSLIAVGAIRWLVAPPSGGASKPAALPAPATMPKAFKEDEVNTLTLTPEAVERLALRTAPVERRSMLRTRTYGGDVTIPAGQAVLVSAPLSGTLEAPPEGLPLVGGAVKKGQPLLRLLPLLSPEGRANLAATRIEADGQVKTAQSQLDAARIAHDRAKKVFASEAGSRRAVDEAQAQLDLAQKSLNAATARRDVLDRVVGEVDKGTADPLTLTSPEDGLLRNLSARPGQNVPAGGALFEVVNLRHLWVRVPVPVGDLSEVNVEAEAAVGDLALRPGQPEREGKPTAAPPSADPLAGTVDLYYNLENRDSRFRPGQRVGVRIALGSEAESLTLPWSAVVHDIHGGTWVYEQTGERTYNRRRVTVQRIERDTAVLASGPVPGAHVVAAGAAELFGAESGFTK